MAFLRSDVINSTHILSVERSKESSNRRQKFKRKGGFQNFCDIVFAKLKNFHKMQLETFSCE